MNTTFTEPHKSYENINAKNQFLLQFEDKYDGDTVLTIENTL